MHAILNVSVVIMLAALTPACVDESPEPDGLPHASHVPDRASSPYDVVLRDLFIRDDTWTNREAVVIVLPNTVAYDLERARAQWAQLASELDGMQLAEVAEFERSFVAEHVAEPVSLGPPSGVPLREREDEDEVVISFWPPSVSDDGRRALVRFSFRPWIGDHGAAGTSLLRRASDESWDLAWTTISRFL